MSSRLPKVLQKRVYQDGSYGSHARGASTSQIKLRMETQGQEHPGGDKTIVVSRNMVEVEARVPKAIERYFDNREGASTSKTKLRMETRGQKDPGGDKITAVSRSMVGIGTRVPKAIGRYSDYHPFKCNKEQKELINLSVGKPDDPEGHRVRNVLDLFREQYTQLMEKQKSTCLKRPYMGVAKFLKEQRMRLSPKKTFGHVPGVKIGDKFILRAELVVIGLHHQFFSGIDHLVLDGQIYATSIVNAGRYDNETKSVDVLIYTGQGGNAKVATDQKLEKGNLAMKNSMEMGYPIRVTYKRKIRYNDLGVRSRQNLVYVYDGLYTINKMWQERARNGRLVFKFELHRQLGQPRTRGANAKSKKVVSSK